jgi:site-specific DNA-methyltransferase (adenine-specific)
MNEEKLINLLNGDCLEQMKTLPDNSVDSIVTDPPYGISFMAKKWDYDVPKVEVWKEAMRVLKPGGHALIACGTRTQHRMVVNIEDAGFEIRDVVSWIYGSGFPKSLNIGKAVDKIQGNEREDLGEKTSASYPDSDGVAHYKNRSKSEGTQVATGGMPRITKGTSEWEGWGTALKPACEFFTLARKPLSESTVAKNVLKWGTGGINIDGCRVGTGNGNPNPSYKPNDKNDVYGKNMGGGAWENTQGRFPANLIHSGEREVLDLFPETGDKSPSRFFYCPKASKKDRNEGCEKLEKKESVVFTNGKAGKCPTHGKSNPSGMNTYSCGCPIQYSNERKAVEPNSNNHPTVKPTALMQYLCRLITPTGGVVLDPYMGSGSTGKAAVKEGFSFVGCELDEDYFKIAKTRIKR